MEVHKDNDVAGVGVWLVFVARKIHSVCAAFTTRRRSPSSTSHDTILSVKLECPHGSIKRSKKPLRRWQRLQGEFSIYLSPLFFYLLLAEADGKREREEGKKQRCAREEKNH
jgi:hypothetical protein